MASRGTYREERVHFVEFLGLDVEELNDSELQVRLMICQSPIGRFIYPHLKLPTGGYHEMLDLLLY